MTTMAMASYTKLKNGDWGVRSNVPVKAGESVQVTKKSGETKTETIDRIVWSGKGVWLCSLRRSNGSGSGRSGGRSGRYICEECGDWVTPGTSCWETGATH